MITDLLRLDFSLVFTFHLSSYLSAGFFAFPLPPTLFLPRPDLLCRLPTFLLLIIWLDSENRVKEPYQARLFYHLHFYKEKLKIQTKKTQTRTKLHSRFDTSRSPGLESRSIFLSSTTKHILSRLNVVSATLLSNLLRPDHIHLP
ncbi:hypothetical protein O181_042450 [Austropuccinia psidii MF-1]|uniref:Uncharacterized protein n=1 Tax=Austropuccinia psidii MF-1 TaxID=1389203 RepID=A0A9Q3HI75_9BASI|nr:hypothetical protein [Austropuccinia psidii MF-1]